MKVLMVDQFLPNSVYVVELCRELRKYAKITIFCKKNAGTDLDGVIWKDKLYAGGKGKMAAVWEYGKGLFRLQKEIKKGSYDVAPVQSYTFLIKTAIKGIFLLSFAFLCSSYHRNFY